ncbi:MAG: DNA-binding response regulator [Bacteroidetes bacterium]|nr:MAG: DNA-binding response regulator [Bacteroidota bacterium]MBL1144195.1 DNA-binding response regulator [Bacteroidota bacterium]NOG56991.1 response regulator transcription factor [Bacteroidota bacterium]
MLSKQLFRVYFTCLIITLTFNRAGAQTIDQHLKVELRQIGHEFLLALNDSTSRVLAIEKNNGRYAIQFEKEFSFEPELLVETTFKVLKTSQLQHDFIVEVQGCESDEVLHSFKTQKDKVDEKIACKGRLLPFACYVFYFTPIQNQKLGITNPLTTESNIKFGYAILGLIMGIALIFYLVKRRLTVQSINDFIQIGQYQFDQKSLMLTLNTQSVELSTKEADLLYLLYTNENKVLERDYILNEVWGDVGDYVGRTLDVFVSKLRKKLSADEQLKIINVRGVGYKFVMT